MADNFIEQEVARMKKKYGGGYTGTDFAQIKKSIISSGILALDYALGTGGWREGAAYYIWGPPDIGKSSSIGLTALAYAQKKGLNVGAILTEPDWDAAWAARHGVDLDKIIPWPADNGEEAFELLHDWVNTKGIDFILFDSIGAVASESEVEGGKAKVGGNSKLITEGVRRIITRAWKNDKTILFLNQIRDDLDSMYGGYTPPGGHAIKHLCPVWIEVKPYGGKDGRITIKKDMGKKIPTEILVGRQLVANIKRNKTSQGTGHDAVFQYWQADTDDHEVGIDVGFDVTNTGIISGVVKKSGGWLYHDSFPGGKLNGKKALEAYLNENPDAYEKIRDEVLQVMINKAGVPKNVELD